MSSPQAPSHIQQLAAARAPVIKIDQQETSTYGLSNASSSPPRTVTAPTRSFSFSSQGGRCHCCGGIFVISNKCSNRECNHVECSQCY